MTLAPYFIPKTKKFGCVGRIDLISLLFSEVLYFSLVIGLELKIVWNLFWGDFGLPYYRPP